MGHWCFICQKSSCSHIDEALRNMAQHPTTLHRDPEVTRQFLEEMMDMDYKARMEQPRKSRLIIPSTTVPIPKFIAMPNYFLRWISRALCHGQK